MQKQSSSLFEATCCMQLFFVKMRWKIDKAEVEKAF